MTDIPPICDYEGSDYQTSFWERGGREYEDLVEAVALRRLLPSRGNFLLELGAGAGRNTPRYQGFERIALLDYSFSQLEQAQARLGRSERYLYVAADVYRLPFVPGLFDAATMIRVLHHLADAPLALRQVREVLQPGAAFILEYANKQNLKAIIRYLFRRQSWSPFTREPVEFAALNFDFHPQSVCGWLQETDFSVERQLTVSHFRASLLKRWVPVRWLVAMDALAQYTGGLWQLTPSVFLRCRAGGAPGPQQKRSDLIASQFFRCPSCRLSLVEISAERITCPACGLQYAIRDGIYDFRQPIPSA